MLASLLLSAVAAAAADTGRITIDDIEARFREMKGTAASTTEKAKPALIGSAVGGGVLLLLLVYMLGRRRGRRRATVVEIRRVV